MSNAVETKLPVVLTRKVAEALESLRKDFDTKDVMRIVFRLENGSNITERAAIVRSFAQDNPDSFVSAVSNGYEIEKTAEELAEEARVQAEKLRVAAEERIRSRYQLKRRHYFETYSREFERAHDNYMDGMLYVLNAYGIKLPGVNA